MASEIYTESSPEVDGWVGKGEALLAREEWEEAVRAFERAAEGSGRSNRDVSQLFIMVVSMRMLTV